MSQRAPSARTERGERPPLASVTGHLPPREDGAAGEAAQNPRAELDRVDDPVDTVTGDPLTQPLEQRLTAVIGFESPAIEPCGAKG
jgi:hypothetical protein